MKLELGCGGTPRPGYVHHDRWQHAPHVDVAHDLDVLPWPWADGSASELLALDVLEHLKLDIAEWLGECWRILAPGGTLVLRLPAWDNPVSWRDPTHRRVFHEETFDFFDPTQHLGAHYGRFYFPDGPWFTVKRVERVNADPRYGIGDLRFTLRRAERPADWPPTPPEAPQTMTIQPIGGGAPVTLTGPNSGHGHVRPRPDGIKARCGGPAICRECAREAGSHKSHPEGAR